MPSTSAPSDHAPIEARYFDGRTAEQRRVRLTLTEDSLVLWEETGRQLTRWPRREVHLVKYTSRETPQLRRGRDGDERLVLARRDDLVRLKRVLPNLMRHESPWREVWRPILLFSAAAAGSLYLLVAVGIPHSADFLAKHIPDDWTRRAGAAARDQMITLLGAVEGKRSKAAIVCRPKTDGAKAIARLVSRLTRSTDDPPRALDVVPLRLKLVNAFALPGNTILLSHGLVDQAESGNEVAAVIAHEIGHLVHHHPTKVALEQAAVSTTFGLLIGDIFGGSVMAGLGGMLVKGAYSREAEREADAWAVEAMNRENMDIRPAATLFERLAREHKDIERALRYLSTHPLSETRAATIRREATGTEAAFTDDEWRSIRAMCD